MVVGERSTPTAMTSVSLLGNYAADVHACCICTLAPHHHMRFFKIGFDAKLLVQEVGWTRLIVTNQLDSTSNLDRRLSQSRPVCNQELARGELHCCATSSHDDGASKLDSLFNTRFHVGNRTREGDIGRWRNQHVKGANKSTNLHRLS